MSGRLAVFADGALRYWLVIFPSARRELRAIRRRALLIEPPPARRLALHALSETGNIEGAAALATFAPAAARRSLTRALVWLQALYNHLDVLAEQPSAEPIARARFLHEALLAALAPGDGEAGGFGEDDGGYLDALVAGCRSSLHRIDGYPAQAARARACALRIVEFQSLTLARTGGEQQQLEQWARALDGCAELEWWEAAGAAGSSLALYALIAASASGERRPQVLAAIEEAYFPWIGALHSLLDSMVDREQDAAEGHLSLIGRYPSSEIAAARMGWLAREAIARASALPGGERHALIVSGMAALYLSASTPPSPSVASSPSSLPTAPRMSGDSLHATVREAIAPALGPALTPALAVFAARRYFDRRDPRGPGGCHDLPDLAGAAGSSGVAGFPADAGSRGLGGSDPCLSGGRGRVEAA